MGKKKDSVALFEVISKSRQKRSEAGLSVPQWMGRGVPVGEPPEPTDGPRKVELSSPRPAPMVSTEGGRLRLSLNYVSALVGIVAVALLMVLAFWIGRWSVHAPAGGATDTGADTANIAGQLQKQFTPATPSRVPGKYYLVIQGLQGMTQQKLQDAEDIVRWLKGYETAAEIRELAKYKQYIVWSLQGFESSDSAEAMGFVETIELLGRRYKADKGGKYDFKHRAGDPWFIPYRQP